MRSLIAPLIVTLSLAGCAGPQPVSDDQPHLEVSSAPWDDARQRGVDFRAIGQEPGWHLEIREGTGILFVYDYGQRSAGFPGVAPSPAEAGDGKVYETRTDAETLTVTITPEPCVDVMSGEPFDFSVSVNLSGSLYPGCGREL